MAADSAGTQTVCLFIGGSVYFILWLWVTAHHLKKSGQETKNKNWGRQMEECCLLACSSLCLKKQNKTMQLLVCRGQRSTGTSWLSFHHEFLELNSGFHAWWQALLPAFESQGFEREQLLDRMRPSKAVSLLLLGISNRMGQPNRHTNISKNNFKKLSVWPDYLILPADRSYISEASVLLSESEVNWLKYTGNNIAPHRLSYWYHCFFPEHSQSPPAPVLNPPQAASSFPY